MYWNDGANDYEFRGIVGAGYNNNFIEIKRLGQKTVINTTDVAVDNQAASGYMDIGTMRMQWGSSASTGTTGHVVTFPVAFPNTNYSIVCQTTNGGNGQTINVISKTTTSFTVTTVDINGTPQNNNFDWQAIGLKP